MWNAWLYIWCLNLQAANENEKEKEKSIYNAIKIYLVSDSIPGIFKNQTNYY